MSRALVVLLLAACSEAPAPPAAAPAHEVAGSAAEPAHDHGSGHEHGAGHEHASPHGGIVQTVGEIHVEALMMPAGVMFYLSDAEEKPLVVDGYSGNAVVKGPSGVTTVDLMSMGDHLHAAASLEQGKPASAVLTLQKDGKAVSASFTTQAVGLQSHDHTALHGGQVGMWGNYHLEYAPKDGQYRVWVTDESRNPVPGALTGTIEDGGKTMPLVQDASGMLAASGEGAGTRPVLVNVDAAGTKFSLGFNAMEAPHTP